MSYGVGYDVGYDVDDIGGGAGTDLFQPFDEAWFSGDVGFSEDVPWPHGASLDGRPLELDLKLLELATINQLRDARDVSALPSEAALSTEGGWKRTRSDWSLGAGQEWADAEEPNPRRFWRSRGVDPWTRRKLCLQPATTLLLADAASATLGLLAAAGRLYARHGTTLRHTADPNAGTVTWATVTGTTSAIGTMTTDGNEVFFVDANGVRRNTIGATASAAYGGVASTMTPDVLAVADGWLVAGDGNELSWLSAAGAVTPIWTHPNTGFKWVAIVGHPEGIFVAGQAADVCEVYRIDVSDDGTTLAPPLYVGGLPRGELITGLEQYQGVLIAATSLGVRLLEVQTNRIDLGDLIPTGQPVHGLDADGRYCWFGWTNYDTDITGLGRLDLGAFPEPLQAAYATDLMRVGQGNVLDVARFAQRTYFAVAGIGFVRADPAGTLVTAGTIDLGRFTWDIYEPKTYLGAEIVVDPLEGAVSAAVIGDDGVSTGLGTLDADGTTGLGVNLGGNVRLTSDSLRPVLTLTADPTEPTKGPCLRRFTQWVLPVPRNVRRYTLPVMLSETVALPIGDGQDYGQDVWDLWLWLTQMVSSSRVVTLQLGRAVHQVTVRSVEMPRGAVSNWATDRAWFEGIALVEVVTKEF